MASMFSKPKMPKPKTQLLPDEAAIEAARKKSIAKQQSRSGRASTLLSDPERLGG